jgi:two-component system chemotaxis response regulator CheB
MRNVIVIGASAGGISATKKLLSGLAGIIDAAVFIVQHVGPTSNINLISQVFQKDMTLHCMVAYDGLEISPPCVHCAG